MLNSENPNFFANSLFVTLFFLQASLTIHLTLFLMPITTGFDFNKLIMNIFLSFCLKLRFLVVAR